MDVQPLVITLSDGTVEKFSPEDKGLWKLLDAATGLRAHTTDVAPHYWIHSSGALLVGVPGASAREVIKVFGPRKWKSVEGGQYWPE